MASCSAVPALARANAESARRPSADRAVAGELAEHVAVADQVGDHHAVAQHRLGDRDLLAVERPRSGCASMRAQVVVDRGPAAPAPTAGGSPSAAAAAGVALDPAVGLRDRRGCTRPASALGVGQVLRPRPSAPCAGTWVSSETSVESRVRSSDLGGVERAAADVDQPDGGQREHGDQRHEQDQRQLGPDARVPQSRKAAALRAARYGVGRRLGRRSGAHDISSLVIPASLRPPDAHGTGHPDHGGEAGATRGTAAISSDAERLWEA